MRRTCPKLTKISGCPKTGAQVLTPGWCSYCQLSPIWTLSCFHPERKYRNASPDSGQPPPHLCLAPIPLYLQLPGFPTPLLSAPICVSRFIGDVWVCECQCCCHSECVSHPSCCHPSPVPRERGREPVGKTDRHRSRLAAGKPESPAVRQGDGGERQGEGRQT